MKRKQTTATILLAGSLILSILACSLSPSTLLFGTLTPTPTLTPTSTTTPTPSPSPSPSPTATPRPINIKILSSLPMTGTSSVQTEAIVNGEELRLQQANYSACSGRYTITFDALDDASPTSGLWDGQREAQNANDAAADESVIAYLGTFDSGAAKYSIPILNQAGPLVMISPANTYPGLTKLMPNDPTEPYVYYPTGVRNYARVTTADDIQGSVAARFMKDKLQVRTVYILDDNELYGISVGDAFQKAASEVGIKVVGRRSIDPGAKSYKGIMSAIARSSKGKLPDAIYAAILFDSNAPQVLKDKVSVLGDNSKVKFVGPDGIQTQSFIDEAGPTIAEGVYASLAGRPLNNLTEAGRNFVKDYEGEYGVLKEPYALYGYEAMNVLLKAIENVCDAGGDATDRETVRAAVFAIQDFSGVLGRWSFDENGDISITDMSFYVVNSGTYLPIGVFQ